MDSSERLQRYKENPCDRTDRIFAKRILLLLNNPKLDEFCMVDAYYYDFSSIPDEILDDLNIYRDAYEAPPMNQMFDKSLLSTPIPDMFNFMLKATK